MKRFSAILLIFALVCSLCACAEEQEEFVSVTDIYLQSAQEFLDQGDLDSAIAALEEGYTATNDPALGARLEELQQQKQEAEAPAEDQPEAPEETPEEAPEETPEEAPEEEPEEEPEPLDLSVYVGAWTEQEVTGTYIDRYLSLQVIQDNLLVYCHCEQQPPYSRIASVEATIPVSQINGMVLEFPFTDSWGNTGVCELDFGEGKIACTIRDLKAPYGGSMWSMWTGTADFVYRYETADDIYAELEQTVLQNAVAEEDQYAVNLFLSNFSEARIYQYPSTLPEWDLRLLLGFTLRYNLINSPQYVYVDTTGSYYVIEEERVDSTLLYFFGRSIAHPYGYQTFENGVIFSDGAYFYPGSSGEYFGYMTVATEMWQNGDGTYDVRFHIYEFSSEVYYGDGDLFAYYSFNDEDAKLCSDLKLVHSGEATMSKRSDGTYVLLQYKVYEC